jgi:hypothetical protein
MNKSDSIAALAAALSKAQAQIEGAIKDSTNPHFRSKYADLSSVVDAIRKPIAANGLAYVQTINQADNAASVSTIIMHASGEWIDCGAIAVPVSKGDAQGYGSALTYARRYSLSAAFGVAPEDDDGNAAARAAPVAVAAPTKAPPKMVSPPLKTNSYEVTNDRAESIFEAASASVDRFKAGDLDGAFDEVSGLTDNGEKLFLWSILKEFSALRAAIKTRWQNGQTVAA